MAVRTEETSLKVEGNIGHYSRTPSLNLQLIADKLAVPEIARLIPALAGIPLQPAVRVAAKGPISNLAMDLDVTSSAGEVSGSVRADFASPVIGLGGTVHVRNLDLAPILKTPTDRTDITGLARFDLGFYRAPTGTSVVGTYAVTAAHVLALGYEARNVEGRGRIDGTKIVVDVRALAYGANTTAAGVLDRVPGPRGRSTITYDLAGRVNDGDLRLLPRFLHVPRIASRLNLDYHVTGAGRAVGADVTLGPSEFAGARFGDNTTGSFSIDGKQVRYAAKGTVSDLDLGRVGQEFDIDVLKQQQYRSSLTGAFDVRGSGTALDTLAIDASGRLTDSQVFEGARIPEMTFEAHLADRRLEVKANGRIAKLDPAVVTGAAAAAGSLTGQVNGQSDPLRPWPAAVARSHHVRRRGEPGAVVVRQGPDRPSRASRQLRAQSGKHCRAEPRRSGRGGEGGGTVGPGRAGQLGSPRSMSRSSRLAELGKLLSQPLGGSALLDGRITGNATSLHATGRLEANGLAYGSASALEVASQFDVTMPDLAPAHLRVTADTSGTFVKIGGQEVNEIHVKTAYGEQSVDFDANLRQMPRSLDAAGTVLLHADHQEVLLRQLALRTQGQEWQMAAGSNAAVQSGKGAVTVKDVRLVSGTQQVAVDGAIGKDASGLRATITGVDLSRLDTLLLGDYRLAGRLDGRATVSGPMDALAAAGDFTVTDGAFRGFKYQSLGGKVGYARDDLSLDVRLQQNPSAWIAARGTLPLVLFKGLPPGSPALADRVDLHVESSPLDLGVVEGLTDQVRKVSGTLQVNLRVTGSVSNPQATGHIDLRNGAFTVVPTNVSYKSLEAGILLQPGQLIIEGMRLVDQHGHALSLGGQFGVEARQIGAVNLQIQGRNFKVLDNDYGQARLNTNLTVSGELMRPEVRGDIDLDTGQINLDQVLERLVSSAYSTTPAKTGTAATASASGQPGLTRVADRAPADGVQAPPAARQAAPALPPSSSVRMGLYDGLTLNVRFRVPNDLVVKGQDLRVGASPIGLGSVNVTIGGDVRIVKKPGDSVRLVGQVNTVRGTYDFQGRRFDILRDGRIRFEGLETIDPSLDVTARRVISGVEADVHLRGSLRKPELALTSQPPLDEADILSLIVFNQPANELGQGQQVSLAQRASALATGFVASKIADSIGRALDLDLFEISTMPEPGAGTGAGATVTIGQQVGQRLYVRLRQGVGADNLSQFVLDYQIADYARVETTMSQGATIAQSLLRRTERGGVDLIFFFSY